jgi:beta-phosphoglucomutase-like phosphatase (HAD superfamily)
MIDLIIFDLDGVLVDTEDIHYNSLLHCISTITTLSTHDIKSIVRRDGTTTKSKLIELQRVFEISDSDLQIIDRLKQELVLKEFQKLVPDQRQIDMLRELELLVPVLAIGSNSRKENVETILDALQIREFFSYVITSDDVINGKPDPEVFNTIMNIAGCKKENTLILEDSPAGRDAVILSGANLLPINSVEDTTLGYIQNELYKHDTYNSGPNGRPRFPVC